MVETTDPSGQPLKLPHRRVLTGRLYRIVEQNVLDIDSGEAYFLLANEHGILFICDKASFNHDFTYVPGGQ